MKNKFLLLLAALFLPLISQAKTSIPKFPGTPETFAGLLSTDKVLLTLSLGKGGAFTGVLDFADGDHDVIKGTVNVSGFFSGKAGGKKLPYTLQITGTSPATYTVATATAESKQILAYPAAYSKGETATEEGTYNTLLSVSGGAGIPAGIGHTTVKIGSDGSAKLSGNLGDGTPVTWGGVVVAGNPNHEIVVYDRGIYHSTQGLFSGVLDFNTVSSPVGLTPLIVPDVIELTGNLLWRKPSGSGDYYPLGFTTSAAAQGLLYAKAVGIPFTTGTLAFTGGVLGSTGTTQAFTVSTAGDVTVTVPNPSDVKLTIDKDSGAVSGSFKAEVPATPKPKLETIKFSGLLLQDGTDSAAGGYFKSPVVSHAGLYGNFILP
jgi:hypothetical protein